MLRPACFSVLLAVLFALPILAAEPAQLDTSRGDKMLAEYFRLETERIERESLADIQSAGDWNTRKDEYRRQLREMLGLDPLPEKTDLRAQVTGKVEHDDFVVENLHFQSSPGLYVTGNFYRPKQAEGKLPTILYVCGHGLVKKDGVSYGNKTHYQHHGAWFARNGYACLIIDTLQLGEIEGIHHGTHRFGMWWWLNRGYTPAGVEAWNCIRALDYLQSRPEVDGERLGVTGRSGGGAYSWWIAALDERIKCAVPVAGITDLRNHVVDGVVEGHCDCMFMVNTYRWDYPQVAAMVAPRPLLIGNTDTDPIFPLDGVIRTFEQVRRIYKLLDVADKVGVGITTGGHQDTQELQTPAFRWFDQHLKKSKEPITKVTEKFFQPQELKVFLELPADEINTKVQESFVPLAKTPEQPADAAGWNAQRDGWLKALREKSFRAWPQDACALDLKPAWNEVHDGVELAAYDFTSQAGVRLRLFVAAREGKKSELAVLNVLDDRAWTEFLATMRPAFAEHFQEEAPGDPDAKAWENQAKMFASFPWAMAYVAPRGVGPTAFNQTEKKQTQIRRRFMLLGQTLDGQRIYDVVRAVAALREAPGYSATPVWLQSHRQMAGVALYAALFAPDIKRVDLYDLPSSHRDGPYLLNVQRFLDLPQTVALAAEKTQVILYGAEPAAWEYPRQCLTKLGWNEKQLQLRKAPTPP